MTQLVKFSLLFLLVIIPLAGFSQNQHQTDLLENELKTVKEDSVKARILNSLSKSFLMTNPDKGLDYANQTLAFANQKKLKKYIIYANQNISTYYYYQSDYRLAREYLLKTIPLIEQINNKALLSEQYGNLANTTEKLSDFSGAIAYSDKALAIATEIKDSTMMAKIIGNRGTIYTDISDYPVALDYLLKALQINEAKKNITAIAKNYLNLGNIYRLENNFDKALYYYKAARLICGKQNDDFLTAASLQNIAEICQFKQERDTSLAYFQQSLNIYRKLGNVNGISSCMSSIGIIFAQKGEFTQAIALASKSIELLQQAGNKNSLSVALGSLGDIYQQQKDYKSAIRYFTKSQVIAKEIKQKNNEVVNYTKLAECYEAINNLSAANKCLKQVDTLKDGIVNETTIKQTAEMEARFSLNKKDKEISLLTKDKEFQRQKLSFLRNFIIIGLILITLLFFFVYRYYHTRQLLKLQTLRTKIASDLHDDIGSTLSSISIFSLIARQESKEVIPLLEQIGEYSRKMLESMADIVWTINPENDNFEKIILRMRSFAFELLGATNIDFKFNVDETVGNLKLPMDTRKNLFLIFKEATNNLAKYAEADSAFFSIKNSKNSLTMLIRDNGKGFDLQKQTEGNGLKNMKARALEIGAKFLIESEPNRGTTIQILMKTA